jgi:MFS superfamily sulfate permease-like transporter
MPKRRSATVWSFAVGNALLALIVLLALFRDPGARSSIAIIPCVLLAALLFASSFGLLRSTAWSLLVLRASAWTGLACGLCALATIAISSLQLSRIEAGIGEGRSLAPLLLLALLLPYLILYPSAQLLWVQRQLRYAERP